MHTEAYIVRRTHLSVDSVSPAPMYRATTTCAACATASANIYDSMANMFAYTLVFMTNSSNLLHTACMQICERLYDIDSPPEGMPMCSSPLNCRLGNGLRQPEDIACAPK